MTTIFITKVQPRLYIDKKKKEIKIHLDRFVTEILWKQKNMFLQGKKIVCEAYSCSWKYKYLQIPFSHVTLDNHLVLLSIPSTNNEVILTADEPIEFFKPMDFTHMRNGGNWFFLIIQTCALIFEILNNMLRRRNFITKERRNAKDNYALETN